MTSATTAWAGRWRTCCVAALAFGLHAAPAWPQPSLTEAQAKAAFVLNFARYVEWPAGAFASPQTPVVACLVGRDTLGSALSALEGRQVQGRPLKVRRGVVPDDMRGCHLVFIGEAEERRTLPILRALAGQPVLTVSDTERFVEAGGAIGLVLGEERLQFEVNRNALEQAQLKASASLLKLARNIP
ncbi:MAG: YfiR family protein [Ideonella sp.]|nr:YfiR family protein [Ideonella sp.]